ncbi:MAG TPA: hypothetical protein DEA08_36095 [Planctomycetes bacterium]|nr:hypothetical protein [Planctomycetota bacterium]
MAGERRKDYMVSKRVHLLYILTWVCSLLLVGSLVWMAVTLRGVNRALPEGGGMFVLVGVLAFAIVCCSLALAVYTIIHTHRLLGSAYRIGVVLKEVNAGMDTRIHLRDGDFFTEIADEINILADKVDAKAGSDASADSDTTDKTSAAAASGDAGDAS